MIRHLTLIGLALILVSAAPNSARELLHEANDAFDHGDHDRARQLFDQVQPWVEDPGLVAFNRGVLLYRADDYTGAEQEFRRCLDDRAVPRERRARALYNLGNSIVQQPREAGADEVRRLRTAIACFQDALDLRLDDPTFVGDVRHNLEITKLLWAEARARSDQSASPNDDPRPEPDPNPTESTGPEQDASQEESTDPQPGIQPESNGVPTHETGPEEASQPSDDPQPREGDVDGRPGQGDLPVLPDHDQLTPLTPTQVREHLSRTADRLIRERRTRAQMAGDNAPPDVKNW